MVMFILPEGYTIIDMLARELGNWEMKESKMSSQSSSSALSQKYLQIHI